MLSVNELKQLQSCLKGLSCCLSSEKCKPIKANSKNSNPNLLLEMAQTASLLSQQLIQLHSQLSTDSSKTPLFMKQLLTPLSSGYNSTARSRESLLSSSLLSSIASSGDEANSSSTSSTGFDYSSLKVKLFEDDDDEMISDSNEANKSDETPMRSSISAQLPPTLARVKEQHRDMCRANSRRKFANKKKYSNIVKSLKFYSSSPDLTQI